MCVYLMHVRCCRCFFWGFQFSFQSSLLMSSVTDDIVYTLKWNQLTLSYSSFTPYIHSTSIDKFNKKRNTVKSKGIRSVHNSFCCHFQRSFTFLYFPFQKWQENVWYTIEQWHRNDIWCFVFRCSFHAVYLKATPLWVVLMMNNDAASFDFQFTIL